MTSFSQRASAAAALTLALASGGAMATNGHTPYPENPTPTVPTPTTPAPTTTTVTANPAANADADANAAAAARAAADARATGTGTGTGTGIGTGGSGTGTGGAARSTGVGSVGTTVGTTVGGTSIGGSKSLGLSISPVQMSNSSANPGLIACPDASAKSWSAFIAGAKEDKSGVNMDCVRELGEQAYKMADLTEFYRIINVMAQSKNDQLVAASLSSFRRASGYANEGIEIAVNNIVRCGEPLLNHKSFVLMATQKDVTCPVVPAIVPSTAGTAETKAPAKLAATHTRAVRKDTTAAEVKCNTVPATARICGDKAPVFSISK